jgi:hypothetical protein
VANDEEMQVLMQFSESGFIASIEEFLNGFKAYYNFKEQIVCYDGVLFNGEKLMIPKS